MILVLEKDEGTSNITISISPTSESDQIFFYEVDFLNGLTGGPIILRRGQTFELRINILDGVGSLTTYLFSSFEDFLLVNIGSAHPEQLVSQSIFMSGSTTFTTP